MRGTFSILNTKHRLGALMVLVTALSIQTTANAALDDSDGICDKALGGRVGTIAADWGTRLDWLGISLIDEEVGNFGLELKAKVRSKVKQDKFDSLIRRSDYVQARAGVTFLESLKNWAVTPIAEMELNIEYIRFARKASDAFCSLPYFKDEFPSRAKNIENLNVGDIALIEGSLLFALPISRISDLGSFELIPTAHVGLRNHYRIHIIKLAEEKIRLKIQSIAYFDKAGGFTLGRPTEIFSNDWLQERTERWFDLLSLGQFHKTAGEKLGFMAEYVIDLKDPEVRLAYERAFKNVYKPQFLGKGMLSTREAKSKIFSELIAGLDEIYKNNVSNPHSPISRAFKGTIEGDPGTSRFKVGAGSLMFGDRRAHRSSERVVALDVYEQGRRYTVERFGISNAYGWMLPALGLTNRYEWADNYLGKHQTKLTSEVSATFAADQKFVPMDTVGLELVTGLRARKLKDKHFNGVNQRLSILLPKRFTERFNDQFTALRPRYGHSSRIVYMLAANSTAVNAIGREKTDKDQLYKEFSSYVERLNRELKEKDLGWIPTTMKVSTIATSRTGETRDIDLIPRVAKGLATVLNGNVPAQKRIDALHDLGKSMLFQQAGMGFLFSLIPDELVEENTSVTIDLSQLEQIGPKVDQIKIGQYDLSEDYRKIIQIDSLLEDEGNSVIEEARKLCRTNPDLCNG